MGEKRLPADLQNELIGRTASIREILDGPKVSRWLWNDHRADTHHSGTIVVIIKEWIYNAPSWDNNLNMWRIGETVGFTLSGLNNAYSEFSPEGVICIPDEVYQFAMREYDGRNFGMKGYECGTSGAKAGQAVLEGGGESHGRFEELRLHAALERAMDIIGDLTMEIEELKLRPPMQGGESYLQAKRHWDETC